MSWKDNHRPEDVTLKAVCAPAGTAGLNMEIDAMTRRNYHSRDPRWIRAKYPGRCHCGREIKPGDRALYFPVSKKLSCLKCGHVDAMRISDDDLNAILKVR